MSDDIAILGTVLLRPEIIAAISEPYQVATTPRTWYKRVPSPASLSVDDLFMRLLNSAVFAWDGHSAITITVRYESDQHDQTALLECDPDVLITEGNRLLAAGDSHGALAAYVHAGFVRAENERGWPHICQRSGQPAG